MPLSPDLPARKCDPETFMAHYRRNARAALHMAETLYLCVLRPRSAQCARLLEEHIARHLYHGEIYCQMESGVYYLQAFYPDESGIRLILDDIADCVPGVTSQYKSVTKYE